MQRWADASLGENLENSAYGVYDAGCMNEARRIHQQKVLRRVQDLKARRRGRKLPKGCCVAKCVGRALLMAPLDFSQVHIPATYEEDD